MMKAVPSARIFVLFLAISTGRVYPKRLISDEPGDFFREWRTAEVELCNYTSISVGPPSGVYDQYVQRSLPYDAPNGNDFVQCAPQPTLFQIRHPYHNYDFFSPSFVRLRRCGGNCGRVHPSILQCVVMETEQITVRVFDTNKGGMCGIRLVNHTKCVCECVTKADGCDENKTFDTDACKCV